MELISEEESHLQRPPAEIVVRLVQAPETRAWCFICGAAIDNRPGPGLFLKGGWERVCEQCTRLRSPVALNEVKWRRDDWEAESDWSR